MVGLKAVFHRWIDSGERRKRRHRRRFARLSRCGPDRRDAGFHRRYALAAYHAGQDDAALQALQWLEDAGELPWQAAAPYIRLLAKRQEFDRAEALYRTYSALHPGREKLLSAGAALAEKSGRFGEAALRLAELAALQPDRESHRARLFAALAKSGAHTRALEMWESGRTPKRHWQMYLESLRAVARYREAYAVALARRTAEPEHWYWHEQIHELEAVLQQQDALAALADQTLPPPESREEVIALAEMYGDCEQDERMAELLRDIPCEATSSAAFPWLWVERLIRRRDWAAVEAWLAVAPPDAQGERLLNQSLAPEARPLAEAFADRLRAERPCPPEIRSIGLVGGSNSVSRNGWAARFRDTAERVYGLTVENRALGASSSLYGLAASRIYGLMHRHDLLIFEYGVNDLIFMYRNNYDLDLLRSVLLQAVRDAAAANCRLMFLLMANDRAWKAIEKNPVLAIYREMEAYGAAVVCMPTRMRDQVRDVFQPLRYSDPAHFLPAFSQRIADAALERLSQGISPPDAARLARARSRLDLSRLTLLPLSEAELPPDAPIERRATAIYEGEFCRIRAGQRIRLPLRGRALLGMIVNCTSETGIAEIALDGESQLRNMTFGRVSKPRVFLRQLPAALVPRDGDSVAEISVATPERLDAQAWNIPPSAYTGTVTEADRDRLIELEIAGFLVM